MNKLQICLLYYIASGTIKYTNWHDGFTKAMHILEESYDITWVNMFDNKNPKLEMYDIIFLKSDFVGHMPQYVMNYFKSRPKKIIGLCISASKTIPTQSQLNFFNILFYETQWYRKYAKLDRHPNIYHAFGVDIDVMKMHKDVKKDYDVLFVGNITDYKRPLNLLNKSGRKIALGFKTNMNLVNKLKNNGVEIKDFIHYSELANYYNRSKLCYVPCQLHGGGERAVLEARACGIDVTVENDNPKLKELLTGEIFTSEYYAKQLNYGIKCFQYCKLSYPEKVIFRKKNPINKTVTMNIDNVEFKMLSNNDDTVIKELYWSNFKKWEVNEMLFTKKLLENIKYDYFFDVGAYTGIYSLFAATIVPDISVHGFEIIKDIEERYKNNVKLNNLNNVTINNMGISNKEGIFKVKIGSFAHGFSSVSQLNKNGDAEIKVTTIDNYIDKFNLNYDKKYLFKIDVEELEAEVISGMVKLLQKSECVDILLEVNSGKLKHIVKNFLPDHKVLNFKNKRNVYLLSNNSKNII